MTTKRVFSGIQPTGEVHLGNYLGALKNWVKLQNEYDCVYCIVDMHAMTIPDPRSLGNAIQFTAAVCLALGIDPVKSILFVQSDVPAHAELAWILTCQTYFGELRRMTQFKEKSGKSQENSGAGLFVYPALMAADILLYDTHTVPVGEDQKQHLELTRTIARRFNNAYGSMFVVPDPYIGRQGARIMALDDPKKKMSKSSSSKQSYISLMDSDDQISQKIKRAVTDSGKDINYDPNKKPAISNLLDIYSEISGQSVKDIEKKFLGRGYGDFKKELAEVVVEGIRPIREKINDILINQKDFLVKTLQDGANKAADISSKKIAMVRKILNMGNNKN